MKLGAVRVYAPERWGALEKFNKFYANTYSLSKSGARSVSGALNHFYKANTLRNLAIKLIPNIKKDEEELNQNGYSRFDFRM